MQVRNPWGRGEFQSGKWDDDGPGWDEFPLVKEVLKHEAKNDGAFWLEKHEFFKYFPKVCLCAKDMRRFADDPHGRQASVVAMEVAKAAEWEAATCVLSAELRNRVRLIFIAIDQQYGDSNGTVEKDELQTFDKNGKMFEKMDASSSGHITSEAFEAYFGSMQTERGEKAVGGCLNHFEKKLALSK